MNTPNRHGAYLRNLEAEYASEALQSEPINTHSLSQIRATEILIRSRRGWGGYGGILSSGKCSVSICSVLHMF